MNRLGIGALMSSDLANITVSANNNTISAGIGPLLGTVTVDATDAVSIVLAQVGSVNNLVFVGTGNNSTFNLSGFTCPISFAEITLLGAIINLVADSQIPTMPNGCNTFNVVGTVNNQILNSDIEIPNNIDVQFASIFAGLDISAALAFNALTPPIYNFSNQAFTPAAQNALFNKLWQLVKVGGDNVHGGTINLTGSDAASPNNLFGISIDAPGLLYEIGDVVSVVGDGTDFAATVSLIGGSGEITSIDISNPGTGYTFAVFSVASALGTGAEISSSIGNALVENFGWTITQ